MTHLFKPTIRFTKARAEEIRVKISNHHKVRNFVKTATLEELREAIQVEGSRPDGRIRMDVLRTLIHAMQEIEKTQLLDRIFQRQRENLADSIAKKS